MSVAFYNSSLNRDVPMTKCIQWMQVLQHPSSDYRSWFIEQGIKSSNIRLVHALACILTVPRSTKHMKCYVQRREPATVIEIPFHFAIKLVSKIPGSKTLRIPRTPISGSFCFNGELRSNQEPLVQSAIQYLRSTRSVILNCDTGKGKTAMSVYLTCYANRRTLVLIHNTGICKQWITEFNKLSNIQASRTPSMNADVVVTTVQSLLRSNNTISPEVIQSYSLVVLDEVHRLCSPAYYSAILRTKPSLLIGCTATLTKDDGTHQVLNYLFNRDSVVVARHTKEAEIVKVLYNSSIRPLTNGQTGILKSCQYNECDFSTSTPCKSHMKTFNAINSIAWNRASIFRCKSHIAEYKQLEVETSSCEFCAYFDYCNSHNTEYGNIADRAYACSKCSFIRSKYPNKNRPHAALVDFAGTVIGPLAESTERNNLIVQLAEHEVNKGNKVMIVTRTIAHTDELAQLLDHHTVSTFRSTDTRFSNSDVLIGTISKMGVGMDEANLCTNFDGRLSSAMILATSIKTDETLRQVIGRLRRSDVRIYDIVDVLIGSSIMEAHWTKRRKVYKKDGYALVDWK